MSDVFYKPWVRFVFRLEDAGVIDLRTTVRLIKFPALCSWRGRAIVRSTVGRKHPR